MAEMRGFVFAITFIMIFSALISTIPAGLQGPENAPETVIPIDPRLLTTFSESVNYTTSSYSLWYAGVYWYDYVLGSKEWVSTTDNSSWFALSAKVLFFGIWFWGVDICSFITLNGENRGEDISFEEITEDADDGAVRYVLELASGDEAGSFIVYWNTTEYGTIGDVWDNDELYLLHGMGFTTTATADIGSLLVGLLFLQLPEVPILINVLLATPLWACIIFVLWFVVKEMIPFV